MAALIDSVLDTTPWRAIERARQFARSRRAARRPAPPMVQPLIMRALESHDEAELTRALRAACDAGAIDIARQISQRIESRSAEVVATMLSLHVASGETDEARSLAEAHRGSLTTTARGATMLDVLEMRERLHPLLPGGALNGFALARAIQRGKLSGPELLSRFSGRPQRWLQSDELHLLASSAFAEHDRAGRFLGRFLRSRGLSPCSLSPGSENVLERVRFSARGRVAHGPLVSVMVAAFNAERTIHYAIDSLLAQTHQRLEILIADDASTDATPDILEARYGDEPRVRLFRSPTNQGPYNLRNALLEEARGKYVAFHDADDLALPTRIERQVRALGARDVVGCTTSWLRITESGHVVFFQNQTATRLAIVSLMLKREALDLTGPFRSVRFGADQEKYEDVRAHFSPARVVRLREPLIFGLWSDRSLTREAGAESLETGYRSPARRAYSELVFRKRCEGALAVSEEEIASRLAELSVTIAPAPLNRLAP